jgi:uncharacterized protein YodC (DUF2158 family)
MTGFTKGMVVQLVSGGPKMSVAEVGDYSPVAEDGVKCVWFNEKNVKCDAVFDAAILEEYVPLNLKVTRA